MARAVRGLEGWFVRRESGVVELRDPPMIAAGVIWILLTWVCAVFVQFPGNHRAGPPPPVAGRIVGTVEILLLGLIFLAPLRTRLWLSADGVRVRRAFSTRSMSWADFEDLRWRPGFALGASMAMPVLELTSGKHIKIHGIRVSRIRVDDLDGMVRSEIARLRAG